MSTAAHPYALTPAVRAYLLATGAMRGPVTMEDIKKLRPQRMLPQPKRTRPGRPSKWAWLREMAIGEVRTLSLVEHPNQETTQSRVCATAYHFCIRVRTRRTPQGLTVTRLS